MDRPTRLMIAHAVVERIRAYPRDALNDLFEAMGEIEHRNDLVPKFTEEEEAEVAAAQRRLERGEKLRKLELSGPIEDFLPEPHASVLVRLNALSEEDRDAILGTISLLIDMDGPRVKLSPAHVAEIRHRMKHQKDV